MKKKYQITLALDVSFYTDFEVEVRSQRELKKKILEGFEFANFKPFWEGAKNNRIIAVKDAEGHIVLRDYVIKIINNQFKLISIEE